LLVVRALLHLGNELPEAPDHHVEGPRKTPELVARIHHDGRFVEPPRGNRGRCARDRANATRHRTRNRNRRNQRHDQDGAAEGD
jgi:hypothetical protein